MPLTHNKVYGFTATIPCGKYKGQIVGNVMELDPEWLLRAEQTYEGFTLTTLAHGITKENIEFKRKENINPEN